MNSKRDYSLGVVLSAINCLSLGVLGVVDKIGTLQTNNPLVFSSQSMLFSLLFTTVFTLFYFRGLPVKQIKAISFPSWGLIILVGVFASGIFILLRFLGLTQSTGTFATLSQVITTSLTALLAFLFLKERLSKIFWVLFAVIIFSVYFVSVGKIALADIKTGDFLIILSTIFLAAANIFARIVVSKVSPILLSLSRFFLGFIFLSTIGFLLLNKEVFHSFTWLATLSGILWAISVLFFNLAIKKIGVTFTTSLLMIAPVITMALEYSLLGYQFTLVQIIAALVVVLSGVGIIFASSKS